MGKNRRNHLRRNCFIFSNTAQPKSDDKAKPKQQSSPASLPMNPALVLRSVATLQSSIGGGVMKKQKVL